MPTQPVPLPLGPMWKAGPDAADVPQGYVRNLENLMIRPGGASGPRLAKRSPWLSKYSAVQSSGSPTAYLGIYDDQQNGVVELIASYDDPAGVANTFELATSSPVDNSVISTGPKRLNASINDYCNYRGSLYAVGNSLVWAWNGSAISPDTAAPPSPPGNVAPEGFTAATIAAFKDRVFYGDCRATIVNFLASLAAAAPYDDSAGVWAKTNVNGTIIGSGAGQTWRLIPTNTTSAKLQISNAASTKNAGKVDIYFNFLAQIQPLDPSAQTPITLQFFVGATWAAGATVNKGEIVTDGAGHRFHCTVAGITGGAPPAWNVAAGATTVDNTVTWVSDGADTIASSEYVVPSASDFAEWQSYYCDVTIPPGMTAINNGVFNIGVRLVWGNSSATSWTNAAINVSYKDGLTNTDPRKKNRGFQLVSSQFRYPFFNAEGVTSNAVKLPDLMWTEIAAPTNIRDSNYQNLIDTPERVTTVRALGEYLVVLKSRAMYIFQATNDPDIPLQLVQKVVGIGCRGPKACDIFEGALYFIGDADVYRWSPGSEAPQPLGGPIREALLLNGMAASASRLRIDRSNRDVYVGSTIPSIDTFVLHLPAQQTPAEPFGWTAITPPFFGLLDYVYLPGWSGMYAIVATGTTIEIARIDGTCATTGLDTLKAGTTNTYTATIKLGGFQKAIPHPDAIVEDLLVYHASSADQTSNTTTASVTTQAGTWTNPVHLSVESPFGMDPIPLWESDPMLSVSIAHAGAGGESNFVITRAAVHVQTLAEEFPQKTPTSAGSTNL